MNYEEKYKEVLEKAKSCLKDGTITNIAKNYIETIFPELVESEDEKIRKAIIKHLISFNNGYYTRPSEDIIDNWIAWLEKQKPVDWSEEDEQRLKNLCSIIDDIRWNKATKDGYKNWLKSLKPQPKEEQDYLLKELTFFLEKEMYKWSGCLATKQCYESVEDLVNKFKKEIE